MATGRAVDRLRALVARGPLVKPAQRRQYLANVAKLSELAEREAMALDDDERGMAVADVYMLSRSATEGWEPSALRSPTTRPTTRSDRVRAADYYEKLNQKLQSQHQAEGLDHEEE